MLKFMKVLIIINKNAKFAIKASFGVSTEQTGFNKYNYFFYLNNLMHAGYVLTKQIILKMEPTMLYCSPLTWKTARAIYIDPRIAEKANNNNNKNNISTR